MSKKSSKSANGHITRGAWGKPRLKRGGQDRLNKANEGYTRKKRNGRG